MPRVKKSNNRTALRFASYLRCSTDDQKQGDYTTIDTQREINRAHIATLGGTMVGEYSDEGKSGTNLDRPGWRKLLADAAEDKFDAVCVTYMSRLGRGNAFIIGEYELAKVNVRVEMVKEKFGDDLMGYMSKTMTTMMDGVYPKMVGQWTRTKMEKMVEKGYRTGGTVPFGYTTIIAEDGGGFHSPDKAPPKRLIPDEATAGFVRAAFDMAATATTLNSIARYLTAVSGRQWHSTTVKNLLTNEVYIGVQAFGQWRNENAHPAIVDREVWDKAQNFLAFRDTTTYSRRRNDDYLYLFRGLVWCPYCNCAYTSNSAHGRNGIVHYYSCQNANKKGNCPVVRVNADKLHKAVFEQIRRAVNHPTVMRRVINECMEAWKPAEPILFEERGPLAKRRQFIKMQMGNYTRAIGEGRAVDALLTALERSEKELAEVEARLERIEHEIKLSKIEKPTVEDVQKLWNEFLETFDESPDEQRGAVAQCFIHRITITGKELAEVEIENISTFASSMVRITPKYGSGWYC